MVDINIPLIDVDEVKTGRGGGKRGGGKKYAKYDAAIETLMPWIKESVDGAKDGTIRVRVEDLAKNMGITGKHETSIYWGTKFVLFGRGYVVTTGQTKAGDPVLLIRAKKDGDVLPASLAKHLGGGAKGPGQGPGQGQELDEGPEEE